MSISETRLTSEPTPDATKAAIMPDGRLPEPLPPPPRPVPALAFDDFLKVDLRAGVIVSAVRVPKKDKLLDLRVDLGEAEPRRIIAGLGKAFEPEALVGQRVVVVANLAPRDFGKGMVSHGMILATCTNEATGALALVTAGESAPPGSTIG